MSDDRPISRREMLGGGLVARLRDRAAEHREGSTPDAHERPPAHLIVRYPTAGRDGTMQETGKRPNPRGQIPVLRPPGAVQEGAFLRDCTRCDACLEACPHGAIVHAPAQFREAAGTPMIDPMGQPCLMCEDYPCITACEPGVLRSDTPPMMGTARVIEQTCIAHQNGFCTVCSERCPVEGAIELDAGRPRVVEDRCTGCGVCQHVCPAPQNAVAIMPTFSRPAAPHDHPAREGDACD